MTDKYKFESLEELLLIFPIHSIFSEQKVIREITCYNVYDFDTELINRLKEDSISLKKIDEGVYIRICIEMNTIFVDGYIYDGKYWYPAQRNLDAYKRLNEYDIFRDKEIIRKGEEYHYRPGINMEVACEPVYNVPKAESEKKIQVDYQSKFYGW